MKARDIMTNNPRACHPQDKICDAINIMKNNNVGAVPVTDGSSGVRLIGILTDRDIALKMCDEKKTCQDLSVESCMHSPVFSCFIDDDLHKVEDMMKQHKVHRIPVTDHQGLLQGIISFSDLAREAYQEKKQGLHDLPEQDLAEIIEEIDQR